MRYLIALIFLTGCMAAEPYVKVKDQPADLIVQVDAVSSPENGWLVIHNDLCGKPGEVIGIRQIGKGSAHGLSIDISKNVTDRIFVSLHRDTGQPGKYEYPYADPEFYSRGVAVMETFSVTGKGQPDAIILADYIELK